MNWTFIADNDPGGDLATAYAAMSAETVASSEEVRVTDIDMAREAGFGQANNFLDGLQDAANASAIPQRVMRWIENPGIDVNNSQVVSVLNGLVPTYVSQAQVDALLALGRVPKYPGLRQEDLEKARRLRSEGKA